ncbi:unnamed protein product [Protopolystoma xenopodis]|uniref:Uncharacterized protein n=1 Tax=Protopolystoma xenopodis TaxID=117903 RepID=A0A3S5AWU7_9PLAT|nr:unnamed protein product [Protopolystoma xenopodis]
MPLRSRVILSVMNPLLHLRMDNSKSLINLLKTVNFKEMATIFATKNGLKISVEDTKCVQGNAFLHSQLFSEFSVSRAVVAFKINYSVFLDCFSVFGTSNQTASTSLLLTYKTDGSTLDLLLEENGVIAECSIHTVEAIEILDFDFSNSNITTKIIIKLCSPIT